MSANFQILHVHSGVALMPVEEPLAQVLAQPQMTHEAFSLHRHVRRWSDRDNTLGMPALSLRERQSSSSQRMPDGQCGSTVATPNRMNRVDEVRKRTQLASAEAVRGLIECDYSEACLA